LNAALPRPLGHSWVAKELGTFVFSAPILGAIQAAPKGLLLVSVSRLLGALGPLLAKNATSPLPASYVYLAVTDRDLRLYGKAFGAVPFELGRWNKFNYGASLRARGLRVSLDLALEGLGHVSLLTPRYFGAAAVQPVLDLVIEGRRGGPANFVER
jgi:hypothetical protein